MAVVQKKKRPGKKGKQQQPQQQPQPQQREERGGTAMAYELSDLNEVEVTFAYLTPDGSPGKVDLSGDAPTLTSSDETAATGILDVKTATRALIRSGDNLPANKPVTFTLTVDVDLGAGVKPLNTVFDMMILSHTSGEVATVNVGFGTPVAKGTTPTP